ncbi:DUF3304 domain-containing protein [Iodobacter sp.]|uniref:DUF3304 domain-containing protein n=1 Tax=Iodobacter sp. TaxID=1915058 RepID=UPI0025F09DA6|nr:DUF3304 domain-containing protein [Iodobacter sp.]
MKIILKLFISIMTIAILTACPSKEEDNTVLGRLTGLNHTKVAIITFYVNDAWGGNIRAMRGGGETTCCVVMPREYPKGGLKVNVRWNATDTLEEHWFEKEVVVDPYPDGAGRVYVHFLPNENIRVIVSDLHPMHKQYPGPGMPGEEKE